MEKLKNYSEHMNVTKKQTESVSYSSDICRPCTGIKHTQLQPVDHSVVTGYQCCYW